MYSEKIALVAVAFAFASTAAWNTEAREPFHYTFSNDQTLDVDNVNGTIQITGDGGNTIRVEGEKIIRAVSQQELERAKKEVTLDVNEKDRIAQLYVNGPFRHGRDSDDDHGFHVHYDDHGYEVTYNFNIHIPRDIELRLRSVNGEIKTEQTGGKFDVSAVNGPVSMTAAAGSGSAHTVNGRLTVSFRENPKAAVDFKTVNGAIEAAFLPGLSADLSFKTLNGAVYTDFDTAALTQPAGTAERKNGKFIYKQDRHTGVRVGSGGPELKFETVNGEIRIRKESSK
jgi:DUF4097 and DUF4098 domain-containing protein YvlB